ncbi:glycine cleavage system protein GcvH [Polynucleobacter difficilis]|jgi:glycine cleavage system H protein|uniref:glycine cleavage system protein GcvH n=1 Tax=Polynucleobacter difficilis TaxID=556054 RepID=UPI000D336C67|nr:glycine cleavage system protein GcvH [Polynucleobacter difficilis]
MTNAKPNYLFADTHEWADLQSDGLVWVGISDHAQIALGDVVFLETPAVGAVVEQGNACAVIESVKAASDIHAPVSGTVVAVNSAAIDAPETINQDPYGTWLFKIQTVSVESQTQELARLHSLAQYESTLN